MESPSREAIACLVVYILTEKEDASLAARNKDKKKEEKPSLKVENLRLLTRRYQTRSCTEYKSSEQFVHSEPFPSSYHRIWFSSISFLRAGSSRWKSHLKKGDLSSSSCTGARKLGSDVVNLVEVFRVVLRHLSQAFGESILCRG